MDPLLAAAAQASPERRRGGVPIGLTLALLGGAVAGTARWVVRRNGNGVSSGAGEAADAEAPSTPPTQSVPVEELDSLRRAFERADVDGSGTVDVEELDGMLRGLGKMFTRAELQEKLTAADADGSGELDFGEFVALAQALRNELSIDFIGEEISRAFEPLVKAFTPPSTPPRPTTT